VSSSIPPKGIPWTHLERLYWPELQATKGDLVDYYVALAPVLLPHLRDRPFTLKQHYTVPRGPYRFVKDAPPELPPVVRRCPQPAKSRHGATVDYALINNRTSLLWMVELGAVDLHVWPSRCDRPDRPDWVLFDIDAERARDAVDAALRVKEALDLLDLVSFVRTSGGEGMHVLVPIARRHTHEESRHGRRGRAPAPPRADRHEDDRPRPAGRRGVLGASAPRRARRDAARLGRAAPAARPAGAEPPHGAGARRGARRPARARAPPPAITCNSGASAQEVISNPISHFFV
jgi:DNA ligase D-like protein (predicted polymerase)